MVLLAIMLLLLMVIFVPRSNVRLTDVGYETSSCNPVTSSVLATAYVTLTNTGEADGHIVVRFYVDGERRATSGFYVARQATVAGTLTATIAGCFPHRYTVDTCYLTGESTTC